MQPVAYCTDLDLGCYRFQVSFPSLYSLSPLFRCHSINSRPFPFHPFLLTLDLQMWALFDTSVGPHFSAHVCCGQIKTAGWSRTPLGTEVGLPRPRRHCARWGSSFPTERGTTARTFGPCLLWPNGRPSQQLLSSFLHRSRHLLPFSFRCL